MAIIGLLVLVASLTYTYYIITQCVKLEMCDIGAEWGAVGGHLTAIVALVTFYKRYETQRPSGQYFDEEE